MTVRHSYVPAVSGVSPSGRRTERAHPPAHCRGESMDATRPVSYDMSHYFGMLRRHWWIIALFTAIGLAGALALVRTQPKVYEATTNVLVTPTSNQAANAAGGRTNGVINLDTEAQLVTSA